MKIRKRKFRSKVRDCEWEGVVKEVRQHVLHGLHLLWKEIHSRARLCSSIYLLRLLETVHHLPQRVTRLQDVLWRQVQEEVSRKYLERYDTVQLSSNINGRAEYFNARNFVCCIGSYRNLNRIQIVRHAG